MVNFKRPFSDIEDKTKLEAWSDKNLFNPTEIGISSSKKVWFDCSKCGHEFQKSLGNVTNGGWCPYCVNNKLCEDVQNCQSCLPKTFYSFSDKDKVSAWAERNTFNPWEVFLTSGKKACFDCRECGHEFESIISNITIHDSWCPFCSNSKICEKSMTCGICLPKTFYGDLDEHKVSAWSNKNEFNPWEVFKSANKKVLFDCHECGHEFDKTLNDITSGSWCPYCVNKKLCKDSRECEKCLPNTFYGGSDDNKVTSWSKKNTLQPWQVSLCSAKKMWFDCKECGHEFQSALTDIKCTNTWCPYCVSKKLCKDSRECEKCLPKTFYGSSDENKVKSWSEKNKLRSWEMFSCSSKKVWFHCKECVEDFECALDHVFRGHWCPKCSSKRNKAMNILIPILDKMKLDYIIEEMINLGNRNLYWDATCSFQGKSFHIESDGAQHFSVKGITNVSRGKLTGDKAIKAFNDQRKRDLLKETYIRVNNGLLFRFSYRQTSKIELIVVKMLEHVKAGKTGVVYMDDIYWG